MWVINTKKDKLIKEVKDIFRTLCERHRWGDFLNFVVGCGCIMVVLVN